MAIWSIVSNLFFITGIFVKLESSSKLSKGIFSLRSFRIINLIFRFNLSIASIESRVWLIQPNLLLTTRITGKSSLSAKSEVNLLLAIGEKKPPHPSI